MRIAGNFLRLALVTLTVFHLVGCRGEKQTPETQIRIQMRLAAAAVEKKDLGTLRDMISDQYRDEQGQDRRTVDNILRLHLLRNESVHLYIRVASVTVSTPDTAVATVLVAMAGVPITAESDLPALRADLHRFEIAFALENKAWRVVRANWRHAEASEFLGL